MGIHAAAVVALILAPAAAGCALPGTGFPVEEGTIPAADGVPLAYDARGEGEPAVLLVHGWRCDRALWRFTAEELARDRRVVRLDLPGHGESGAARDAWTVEALAGDVAAVVEALGLRRVVLVGHSMAGPVCLAAAARLPGRVAAVVGVDTLHDVEYRWPEEEAAPVLAALEADPEGSLRRFLPGMIAPDADPGLAEWILDRALRADDAAAAALMRALVRTDAAPLLAAAGVPVRCLNAAPGTTPYGMPTAVERNRAHGDFDVVLLEGVGHYPMVERPFTFAARLREVLAGLR